MFNFPSGAGTVNESNEISIMPFRLTKYEKKIITTVELLKQAHFILLKEDKNMYKGKRICEL